MDSAASKMNVRRDGGNVIELIGGSDAPVDNYPISGTGRELINDRNGIHFPTSGYEPPVMETRNQSREIGEMFFNTRSFGSSSFMMENQGSCKDRHCRNFFTEAGCLYGDQCGFLHDGESRKRERHAIILNPQVQSNVGYGNGVGIGNGNGGGIGIGYGGGNGNAGQVAANATVKRANWRTRLCNKWEMQGYCPFGLRCTFAHGAAELQRYGGGPVQQEANPNNQWLMSPNNAALPGSSSVAHAAAPSGSTVARAGDGGSGQVPGPVEKPWKGPKKINRIYGDWIDDLE